MTNKFKKIGLISKRGDPNMGDTLLELVQYLDRRKLEILLDETSFNLVTASKALSSELRDKFSMVNHASMGQGCELVFVVGGDGTILDAARTLVDSQVPIIGINLGRLGFLADISPTEMAEKLDQILDGEYEEEQRAMLHARVLRNGKLVGESPAFNDVVIHSRNVARMIEYENYIDGQFVNRANGDGLIVATPTGSTAYALSSGGPIVHPSLNVVVLVTICPHTMSLRPIVVNADSTIEIIFSERNQTSAQVSCDGQVDINLENGDRIVIKRKTHPIRLIHPNGYDYYSILRAKLHWGIRLKPD